MSSKLCLISDWPRLGHASRYNCEALAVLCGVSMRQLERFYHIEFKTTPKRWMQNLRMQRALALLKLGYSTNAVSDELFFKSASHFCRNFKAHFGCPPQFRAPSPTCRLSSAMSQLGQSGSLKVDIETLRVVSEEPKNKNL